MFRFLHAADLHLDSPMHMLERYEGAPVEEMRLATRQALTNLVQLAMDEAVAFVLIAGDLYDGDWKDYNTGLFFVQQMTKLKDAAIPIFLVSGNHDAENKMTKSLPWPDNVKFLKVKHPETVRLDDLGVSIHGQGFDKPAVTTDLSAQFPQPDKGRFNIGLLHTSVNGREGHAPYAPCRVEDLRLRGYDYWALGHIHNRETLAEGPIIAFPGNTQGRSIRETGPKGCLLVTVSASLEPTAEFRPLDVARWELCPIDLAQETHESNAWDLVRRELERVQNESEGRICVVRLELNNGSIADTDKERWTNAFRSLAIEMGERIWIEKIIWRRPAAKVARNASVEAGPLSALLQTLEEARSDEDRLASLVAPFADLFAKLPLGLREEWPMADRAGLDWARRLLDEIEPDLLSKLGGSAPEAGP